jgi:hypothetical protein
VSIVEEIESESYENQYWGVHDDYWNHIKYREITEKFILEYTITDKYTKNKLESLISEYDRRFINATQELTAPIWTIEIEEIKWIAKRIPNYPGKVLAELMQLEHPDVDLGIQNIPL